MAPPLPEPRALELAPPEDEDVAAAQPKGEDRIEQILQEAEQADPDAEVAAVAPRKVRTMIVKPDGTLVPREDPAPAAPEAAAPAPAVPEATACRAVGRTRAGTAGGSGGANVTPPSGSSGRPMCLRRWKRCRCRPKRRRRRPKRAAVAEDAAIGRGTRGGSTCRRGTGIGRHSGGCADRAAAPGRAAGRRRRRGQGRQGQA